MDSKHTPGPWKPEKVYGNWDVYDAEENLVATIHGAEAHQQKPNVRLIAAAPDMLEALKGLYETGAPEGLALTANDLHRRFEAARAAIAKATGGQ